MSHKDKHSHSHKAAKKAAIAARNKRDIRVNEQAEFHEDSLRRERERDRELHAAPAAKTGTDGEVVWSAKLQEVRDRITGKKRMATDRWNRFAGTSGGGGRGR
jgi:hypothetical protein